MANAAPTTTDHPIIRTADACALVGVTRAEHATYDHLARDRNRVQDEREKEEKLRRDLMRRELRIAHPRADRRRDEKGRKQRGRPHEDLPADAHHRAHRLQARALRVGVGPQQFHHERQTHPGLGNSRSRCGSGDSPVEAVHEQHLENDVRDVRDDDDLERPPQVRDTAQVPLPRERDESRRQPDRRDSEVGDRIVA